MKKIIALVLAILTLTMAFTMVSCGYNDVEKIKKAGKIVVYTEAGFAPYEYIYNNKIVGVDVAIMQAVADELGVELEYGDVSFDSICASVKSGKCDVGAAAITIRPDRAEMVDFSVPYSSTAQYVIVAADNNSINNVTDLKGKIIGVQQGTTSDSLVDDLIKNGAMEGATLTPYDAPAVAAASIGKIDAVVSDKLTAEIIVANNNGKYKTFKLVNADGSDVAEIEEYGIAVAKGNTTLLDTINKVLNKLIADGTVDKWVQEYTDLANTIEG